MVNLLKWSKLTTFLLIGLNSSIFLSNVNAAPIEGLTHEVHELRKRAPSGWIQGDRLNENVILPVRIALTQSNIDKLHDYLMQVSDPDSPQYGQHWKPEKVRETFKPSTETRETVSHWLIASGISSERLSFNHGSQSWIQFDATVKEAEKLFQTEYYSWSHSKALNTQKSIAAVAQSYSLPSHLRTHIDFITPTLHFDAKLDHRRERMEKRSKIGNSKVNLGSANGPGVPLSIPVSNPKNIINQLQQCNEYITPICLRALYGIPILPSTLPTNKQNSFGIVEYGQQSYIPSDLKTFFANYSTNQKQIAPTLVSIDGGSITTNSDPNYAVESNLDLEYGMSLVNPISVTLYQTGDTVEGASFNDFLDALDGSYCSGDDSFQDAQYPDPYGGYQGPKSCGTTTAAKVISTSYAYNEYDLTDPYKIRQCNEYAKLGLLGTTFVFSSGDYGVAGNYDECVDLSRNVYIDGTSGRFNPSFPGTCPYVLSVGATEILPNKTVLDQEVASYSFSSGGGFSNVFGLPNYQKSAISNYYSKYPPTYTAAQNNNSQTSRGFPDISANGAKYVVDIGGGVYRVYGTSASTPVTGAILTLINEERLNVGKSTLGFVNPTFYANPWMFNDITNGSNPGCGTNGYSAVPGWDPVTGLGTPNLPKMLSFFLTH